MKNVFVILLSIILPGMVVNPRLLSAQDPDWGGYLLSDLRLNAGDNFDFTGSHFSRAELRLDHHAEAKPTDRIRLYGEGWLRAWGFPTLSGLNDLSSHEKLMPFIGELREAYVDLYGFVFDDLDLRAGRQRIAWGTAEKVSVIDNLNPDDLEDRWDFGRHLASDALKLTYYLDILTIEAVYIPIFRPARFPEDISSLMPGSIPPLPPPAFLNSLTTLLTAPPPTDPLQNATLGSRLAIYLFGWDISLSYIYGRNDFPAATNTRATL